MPDSSDRTRPRVAIVGAGITGLAAAHRLAEIAPGVDLTIYEAAARAGGVLHTVARDGYLIERSADNFLTKEPWAEDLCRRVGLGNELLPTDAKRRKALVVHEGKVHPAPAGFVLMSPKKVGSVLRTPLLSWRAKLRLLAEPLVPRRKAAGDESVAAFARRRLGREVFDRLVQPLLAGIYTADPEKLSMTATMPQFVEQEAKHGSLCLAAQREATPDPERSRESGARYGLFLAPRLGMQQLVDALVDRLPAGALRLSSPVTAVHRDEDCWVVATADGRESYDAVLVTTPAHHAATLLATANESLAAVLAEIEYAGCSIVCLGFRREQIATEIEGFGFVVPAVENRRLIAASFSSLKFPGRAPDDQILVRVFIGGALQPGLAELPDDELVRLAREELSDLIGLQGEPLHTEIARWPRGMPQYHLGHRERVATIEQHVQSLPGLELAGAAYRGVGVPQCIHGGEQAAERISTHLATEA